MPVDVGTCTGGKLLQASLAATGEHSVKTVTEHHVLLILAIRHFLKLSFQPIGDKLRDWQCSLPSSRKV